MSDFRSHAKFSIANSSRHIHRALRVDAAPTADRPLSSSWQAREADCPTEKAELCATEQGEGSGEEARSAPLS